MKRFYNTVTIKHDPHDDRNAWLIMLDDKPVKTPVKNPLKTIHKALAEKIRFEWDLEEGAGINPAAMPYTRILSTQIDKVVASKDDTKDGIIKYCDSDLLCYQVDEPEKLAEWQAERWTPHIKWVDEIFGVSYAITQAITFQPQSRKIHDSVRKYLDDLNDESLTIAHLLTPLSGSIILTIAFLEKKISPEEILTACRLEELYKASLYGQNDSEIELKHQALLTEFRTFREYLDAAA